jgi:hypothetical protein
VGVQRLDTPGRLLRLHRLENKGWRLETKHWRLETTVSKLESIDEIAENIIPSQSPFTAIYHAVKETKIHLPPIKFRFDPKCHVLPLTTPRQT